jgi:hypothetical protein
MLNTNTGSRVLTPGSGSQADIYFVRRDRISRPPRHRTKKTMHDIAIISALVVIR